MEVITAAIPVVIRGQYNHWQYTGRADICSRYVVYELEEDSDRNEYELTTMGSSVFLRRMPYMFGHMFNASDPEFLNQIKEAVCREDFFLDGWPTAMSVLGRS